MNVNKPRERKRYERDYYVRADVVRRLRNRAHMTSKELGKASGVNYTTINRIERGHNKSPQWKTLIPLAKVFGVDVDDLVVYTDTLPSEPGMTLENELRLAEKRDEYSRRSEEKRRAREADLRDPGDRDRL